ncbi:MAG: peptide chain release factor 1 [Chlamydiales bacterium]|nr:peptide chain release factor 1 [Chlamydiales bacterium]
MNPKYDDACIRLKELEEELSLPDAASDTKKFRERTQEYARLADLKALFEAVSKGETDLKDNEELLKAEKDPEFIEVLNAEIELIKKNLEESRHTLEMALYPPSPYDSMNTIIELRAGAGGDEAALFVGDCVRMYERYANKMGWKVERLNIAESEVGGFKEYVAVFSGPNVFRYLQYEGGTHRVQRVPATEAQGRVHTSTITCAALVEPQEDEDIEINEDDLRIDTMRASGAGGQHVNKTDSAVRITHLPTNIVVFCQEERSQHKNRDKAMRVLRAKLAEVEMRKKKEAIDATRLSQVGSGDRAEKIRTYNFPQNRLTDHRIDLTKYNLDQIINGDLRDISEALIAFYLKPQE